MADARPGVRRSRHPAGDDPRPFHGPPAAGTAARRDPAAHGPDGRRRSRRARAEISPARRTRRDRRGLNACWISSSVQSVAAGADRRGDARSVAPKRAAGGQPAPAVHGARVARRAPSGRRARPGGRQRRPSGGHAVEPGSGYVQMIRDDPRTDERTRGRGCRPSNADSAGDTRAARRCSITRATLRASRRWRSRT